MPDNIYAITKVFWMAWALVASAADAVGTAHLDKHDCFNWHTSHLQLHQLALLPNSIVEMRIINIKIVIKIFLLLHS